MLRFVSKRGGQMVAALTVLGLAFGLGACGGGGGSRSQAGTAAVVSDEFPPGVAGLVVGTLEGGDVVPDSDFLRISASSAQVTIDDQTAPIAIDAEGRFRIEDVVDGHHTLHVDHPDGIEAHIPFRMGGDRGLSLGRILITDGEFESFTGFNGYHFGFVDTDEDGRNDHFADADGDGVCDGGLAYEGYAYLMPHGFVDENGDGRNDRFRDANGDGLNDLDGVHYNQGIGYVDTDGDGVNDMFRDADGDGICDLTSMPFRHPFGWMDSDDDGVNDRFTDTNGDGENDLTGENYIAMPGWADLDGDHMNDFFRDANGDGVNDLTDVPMGYAHGFGWKDSDGDDVNDHFVDADGDGVNDLNVGQFGAMHRGYGFSSPGVDANGDGIDDLTGRMIAHGFGWVDGDHDHMNDFFQDADGNGVNDLTGHEYDSGHSMLEDIEDGTPGHDGWPSHGHGVASGQ